MANSLRMRLLNSLATIVVLLWAGNVHAQQPPGGMGGGPGQGQIGVAVVFPHGTEAVKLVTRRADERDVQAFTDDGSFGFDFRGDGEYWALVNPVPGETTFYVSGHAAGLPVWHAETVSVPGAWVSSIYPVTLLATRSDNQWTLRRVMTAPLPAPTPPTGAGVTSIGEGVGLSAGALTAIWSLIVFGILTLASLRGAVLRVRQDQ